AGAGARRGRAGDLHLQGQGICRVGSGRQFDPRAQGGGSACGVSPALSQLPEVTTPLEGPLPASCSIAALNAAPRTRICAELSIHRSSTLAAEPEPTVPG